MSLTFEYRGEFFPQREPSAATGGKKPAQSPDAGGPGLTVQVTAHDWTPRSKLYVARVAAEGPAGSWRRTVLPLSKFATSDGEPLRSWHDLDKIEILGLGSKRNPPQFARFEWVNR